MTAKTAKKEGLEVLLVEQKREIVRVRQTCAEGLITRPNCDREMVTIEVEKIIFHMNDFSIPYHGPWVEMKQSLLMSPNGSKIIIEREETSVASISNKKVLLEDLLSEIEKSGCEIENEARGIKAENVNGEVLVTLQSKEKQRGVRSKIAIATDGVNSRIVEGLGLNKNRKFFDTSIVSSYILEGITTPFPMHLSCFLAGFINSLPISLLPVVITFFPSCPYAMVSGVQKRLTPGHAELILYPYQL